MRCYLILGVIKTVNVFVAPESAEDELKSTKVNIGPLRQSVRRAYTLRSTCFNLCVLLVKRLQKFVLMLVQKYSEGGRLRIY